MDDNTETSKEWAILPFDSESSKRHSSVEDSVASLDLEASGKNAMCTVQTRCRQQTKQQYHQKSPTSGSDYIRALSCATTNVNALVIVAAAAAATTTTCTDGSYCRLCLLVEDEPLDEIEGRNRIFNG